MNFSRKWMFLVLLLLLICIAPFRNVEAYIDPGTGNYLLQVVLAALFGVVFALKVFWTRIKGNLTCVRALLSGSKQTSAHE
jgi:hypothetical protein